MPQTPTPAPLPDDATPDPNGETVLIDSPSADLIDRPPWWRWVVDRNPLFLMSGVCMFAGCFAISRAIHADPDNPKALAMLLGLLAVLNLYELMVIALGLVLSRSRALVRDARHLLGLALLLMIDVGFVYHESATASLLAGVVIGAVATALGLVKAVAITRGVGVRLSMPAMSLVGLDLGAVFFLPVIMRWIAGDGFVSPGAMLGVFSAAGLLIAMHAVPGVWVRSVRSAGTDLHQLQRLARGAVLVLPVASAVAHVAVGPWVYGTGYTAAYMSPLLLGLAVVVGRQLALLGAAQAATRSALVLACAAVASTLRVPDTLVGMFDGPVDVYISPLRGALLVSAGVVLWLAFRDRRISLHGVSVSAAGLAALGHTPWVMLVRLGRGLAAVWEGVLAVVPQSQLEWGVLGVGGAFTLLIGGAALSWWRHRQDRDVRHPIAPSSGRA